MVEVEVARVAAGMEDDGMVEGVEVGVARVVEMEVAPVAGLEDVACEVAWGVASVEVALMGHGVAWGVTCVEVALMGR